MEDSNVEIVQDSSKQASWVVLFPSEYTLLTGLIGISWQLFWSLGSQVPWKAFLSKEEVLDILKSSRSMQGVEITNLIIGLNEIFCSLVIQYTWEFPAFREEWKLILNWITLPFPFISIGLFN